MRILLIGGTGTISSAITALISKRIASGESKDELWVLNRGNRAACLPSGVRQIVADAYDKESLSKAVDGLQFDVVCYFIGFELNQVIVAHDVFAGKIKQFVYISSASAYQKPPASYLITESTPLENPFWEYSRKKIQCEDYLFEKCSAEGFPATVVRPSHTYCERSVPLGLHGAKGSWQVLKRMIEGKPVIVHGDGTSLWTMTDSRDFAVAFTGLLGKKEAIGQAFHITSDESITWNQIYSDIADALSECLGRAVNPVLHHVTSERIIKEGFAYGYDNVGNLLGDKANSVVFDNSKVKALVPEFKAKISHKEGTLRAVRYMLEHEELQVEDPQFDAFCDYLAGL
ncbi:MAG: NAD-dependent epimerase/dehydratase family protein [Spirochaetales bacterium]|nr:NAD-dependent epimerase/dehydratase family protein [Spirochaetales bacterium]